MRTPPAFDLTLRDAPLWCALQVALWALAGAGLASWWQAGAVGCVLAAALAGVIGWRLGPPQMARVRWSGQRWELQAPDGWQPAVLRAMLDLGGWMLLRVQPVGGRGCWVGVSGAALGPSGHLLRAALYCAPCVDPGRADEDRARS